MDDKIKETVLRVCAASEKLRIKVVLIGAMVGQMSPEVGADYPPFRRTNDADFGVAIRDWESYRKLYDELIERGFKPDPLIEHRLHRDSTMVDLIPYGAQIAPEGKLSWPKSGNTMTVIGFEEVCAAADPAGGANALPVSVITLPGFVLLKVISYLERKSESDAKYRDDAKDIAYCLLNYASGAKDDRRYSLAGQADLKHEDYETAGAVLMGQEVGKLASPEAAAYIDPFLAESEDLYSPFMDVLAAGQLDRETGDKKRREGQALLAAFKKGYLHARKAR